MGGAVLNSFFEGHPRVSMVLSPELVRVACLHPGGDDLAHLMAAANPDSSLLEIATALQQFLRGDEIDCQFCIVYAAE